jgi:hypothetical protein
MTPKAVHYSSAVVAFALMMGGCNSTAIDYGPLAVYSGERTEDDASLEGTLVLDGGCLYVVDPEFQQRWLVAVPSGARWDNDEDALELDGKRLPAGASVSLSGSYLDSAGVVPGLEWDRPPGSECGVNRTFVVGAAE